MAQIRETVEYYNDEKTIKKKSHLIPMPTPPFGTIEEMFPKVINALLEKRKKTKGLTPMDQVNLNKISENKYTIDILPVLKIYLNQRWTYELIK